MTDKTVPQLTAASALTGAELMHVVQGGNPRKVALNQIKVRLTAAGRLTVILLAP